jgi:hypothetical protein
MVDVDRALTFLDSADRPVEAAWARWTNGQGTPEAVIAALAQYQNPDGGFGQGLEPDIGAPSSNPFATQLALQILLALGATGDVPLLARTVKWLEERQDEDGCWRLPGDVQEHPLAPWFAAWNFPSLNPALGLAGYAKRLGIGSERLHARVRRLWDRMASREEIAGAEFYTLLPYVDYVPWVEVPEQEEYLEALAAEIQSGLGRGVYEDAGHFFGHVGPANGPLARRLPADLIAGQLDRLEREQESDGGWPSPYAAHWRPWTTAAALANLRNYGRL